MKKLASILLLVFAFTFTAQAQRGQRGDKMRKMERMTPEQKVTLTVKRLTLKLDLTKDQAKKVSTLFSKMSKNRMAKVRKMKKSHGETRAKLAKVKKGSKDNADFKKKVAKLVKEGKIKREDLGKMRKRGGDFNTQNQALDHQIAFQNSMKKILTKEQYEKFKKLKKHRVKKSKHMMAKKKKVRKHRSRH